MGLTQSHNTYTVENKNSYEIFGTGNSLTGNNTTGDLSNTGTTDVKPSTSLKYSEDINPGFGGISLHKDFGKWKLTTTIEHNIGVISTARHAITSRIDCSMYDPETITDCLKLNNKINTIGPNDAIKGNTQLDPETTGELINCYKGIVENLDNRSDRWHSTFAISGIRNNEITTKPTKMGLKAAYLRLDDHERDSAEEVLTTLGPRFGIINKCKQLVPSDLSTKKIEDIGTKFGRYGDLKVAGDDISKAQDSLLFSRLHTKHGEIINANWYTAKSFETHNLFGILQESTGYYNHVDPSTGNYKVMRKGTLFEKVMYNGQRVEYLSLLPVCFQHFEIIENRQIELIVTGNIEIIQGEWKDAKPTRIGLLYKRNDEFGFQPGILLGSSALKFHSNDKPTNYKDQDVKEIHINDPKCTVFTTEDSKTLYNYRSDFYINIVINQLQKYKLATVINVEGVLDNDDQITVYLVIMDCPIHKTWVRVETPSVRVTQYGPPSSITIVGKRFDGKVLDLLGCVPDWFRSDDPIDATNIFLDTVSPLFPYLTRMSEIHTRGTSGSYELTLSIVKYEREYSKLKKLSDDELREHIRVLITSLREWLYVSHPISDYKMLSRRHIFMRLFETICFQLMSHVHVYAPRLSDAITYYNSDAKTYLEMESKVDRALINSDKSKELFSKLNINIIDGDLY